MGKVSNIGRHHAVAAMINSRIWDWATDKYIATVRTHADGGPVSDASAQYIDDVFKAVRDHGEFDAAHALIAHSAAGGLRGTAGGSQILPLIGREWQEEAKPWASRANTSNGADVNYHLNYRVTVTNDPEEPTGTAFSVVGTAGAGQVGAFELPLNVGNLITGERYRLTFEAKRNSGTNLFRPQLRKDNGPSSAYLSDVVMQTYWKTFESETVCGSSLYGSPRLQFTSVYPGTSHSMDIEIRNLRLHREWDQGGNGWEAVPTVAPALDPLRGGWLTLVNGAPFDGNYNNGDDYSILDVDGYSFDNQLRASYLGTTEFSASHVAVFGLGAGQVDAHADDHGAMVKRNGGGTTLVALAPGASPSISRGVSDGELVEISTILSIAADEVRVKSNGGVSTDSAGISFPATLRPEYVTLMGRYLSGAIQNRQSAQPYGFLLTNSFPGHSTQDALAAALNTALAGLKGTSNP